jgi:hypothetical protein
VEQLRAQLGFEGAYSLGERWLGDVHGFGRPSEATLVDHGDDIAELAKIHSGSLSDR